MKLLEGVRLEAPALPALPALPTGRAAATAAAAVAVGVTASGCIYLLTCSSGGGAGEERQAVKLATLAELNRFSGLRGRLTAGLAWVWLGPRVDVVAVPNAGPALAAFPIGLCSATQLTALNLSGAAISELPPQIGALRHLEDLDLSRNQLASVPAEIGALTSLKYLNLMGNQLEELPQSIGQLSRLYRLGLKSNALRSLPSSIGALGELVELFITDNRLESLPAEMGQLIKLVKCQASFNDRLTALPAEMGSLPRLELLRCACCNIHELPPSFANLRSLAWVSLASNPLTGAKHPSYASSHLPKVKLEELELGRKLGEGASGEVFAARWRGREVAVKIFQAEKSPDGHSRDEMAIAVALSNAHLIKMLGVLEEPLGLVMELVQGRPLALKPNFESLLRCRWAPGRTFSLDFVLRVAGGLADALEHMHYRGVAHGDVYAHNVLADEEGRVYLCDYGASFFYKKGGPVPFEGQEVRAFGLLLDDLVQRLELSFDGMEAQLTAQKALIQLAQTCKTGPPAKRPCFGAVGRQLKAIRKAAAKGAGRPTPAATPAATPRATPTSTPRGVPAPGLAS